MFFCFSYNNVNKEVKVFINGKQVMQKIIETHLDSFEISENFLETEKFGNAYQFSGKFSDLNIWSTILSVEQFLLA